MAIIGAKQPMEKSTMQKQLKAPPPLREQSPRRKSVRRPKDISFSVALDKLKRGFRVKRASWSGFCLVIKEDVKGDKYIYSNAIDGNAEGMRHTFDQQELLASDWMVL